VIVCRPGQSTQATINFQKIAKEGRVKQPAKHGSKLVHDVIGELARGGGGAAGTWL